MRRFLGKIYKQLTMVCVDLEKLMIKYVCMLVRYKVGGQLLREN